MSLEDGKLQEYAEDGLTIGDWHKTLSFPYVDVHIRLHGLTSPRTHQYTRVSATLRNFYS